MITAFVGTVNDVSETTIRGCGKTNAMTGIAYLSHLEGNRIFTNYKTTFSEEVLGLQAMIDKIREDHENGEERLSNTILCASEMQQILNSIGSTTNQVLFIDQFCSQLRKLDVDFMYDTQRFNNIHLRLRIHTDNIFQPFKFHMDNTACNFDRCKKPHKIYLYSYKPHKPKPIIKFDATKVGQLYDSKEMIYDILNIPNKHKSRSED